MKGFSKNTLPNTLHGLSLEDFILAVLLVCYLAEGGIREAGWVLTRSGWPWRVMNPYTPSFVRNMF